MFLDDPRVVRAFESNRKGLTGLLHVAQGASDERIETVVKGDPTNPLLAFRDQSFAGEQEGRVLEVPTHIDWIKGHSLVVRQQESLKAKLRRSVAYVRQHDGHEHDLLIDLGPNGRTVGEVRGTLPEGVEATRTDSPYVLTIHLQDPESE
jgi:hypothetical protein